MNIKSVSRVAQACFLGLAVVFAPAVLADDPVVAEVDGSKIRRSLLEQQAMMTGQELNENNYNEILSQLIEARIVALKSKDLDLHDTDEFKRLMRFAEEQQLVRAYLNYAKNELGSQEVREAYAEWFEKNPSYDQAELQRMILPNEGLAREVIGMLNDGEYFEELARQYSQDPLAEKGGVLGRVSRGNLPENMASVVFAMSPGEVTQQPINIGNKFYIFKVTWKGRGEIPAFDTVEAGLRTAIAAKKVKKEAEALKLEKSIKIYNMDGSSRN